MCLYLQQCHCFRSTGLLALHGISHTLVYKSGVYLSDWASPFFRYPLLIFGNVLDCVVEQ